MRTISATGSSRRWAFTLIELVIVMTVLAIILVGAVPRFAQTAQRLQVERAAFEMMQLLRYARERAVAESRETVWRWDESTHRARVEPSSDQVPPEPAGGGERRVEERTLQSSRLPADVEVRPVQDGAEVDEVRFFPDGTSQPVTIQISREPHRYTVTLDATTGEPRLFSGTPPR